MWAKYRGATRVFSIDCVEERLAKARSQGAETIDFSKASVVETMQKMIPGQIPSASDMNTTPVRFKQVVLMYAWMQWAFVTRRVGSLRSFYLHL